MGDKDDDVQAHNPAQFSRFEGQLEMKGDQT
jgi:hypothetical protein